MKKRLVALLLVFSLSACLCVSAFAADTGIDIIDDPLSYYFQNQLLGVQKGTGVTLVCPNGDYKTLYTGGTLVTCPYDGEALELASEGGVTAKKAPSGVGRKDLPGYQSSDNNPGVPSISQDGNIALLAKYRFTNNQKQLVDSFSKQVGNDIWNFGENSLYIERYSNSQTYCYTYGGYILDTNNIPGIYYIPAGTSYVFNPWGDYYKRNLNKRQWPEIVSKSIASVSSNGTKRYICIYKYNADRSSQGSPDMSLSVGDGTDNIFQQDSGYTISTSGNITIPYPKDLVVYLRPTSTNIVKNTNITINNNTWNGNIYVDNSTNLTYIYPEYTTINENNETVTNISTNPIIYNSETKQYYTYDTVTNNYYYITYGDTPATPTPSPSPTPDPDNPSVTPTPTPTPGGDTGDATGILAVLVEIRDNMVQGFLDIKAAFVAGFAELSANFTLAIENLNVNIQNTFNKKFPDQSTPETALPSPTPSPSPAPLDPILPETQNLIIPKMNSNTFTDEHGTWIASGSSKYSDVFDFFHAFDRSTSDFWETNASPSYLQIEIPDPESYYIDGYIMRMSKFNNRYAKEWTLQGSDDGNTWDDLDKQTGQNLSDLEEHKYPLTLRKAYKYYRLNMANYASSMCSLSHFNLLGYDAKDVVTPTPSPTDPPSPSPAPDPGTDPTPVPTPSGGTVPAPGGDSNISGRDDEGLFGWLWDLLKDLVKAILKAIFKILSNILGFLIWIVERVGLLLPFMPAPAIAALGAGVVLIFVIRIIRFIRG